jgi:hypothetical protein
MGVAICVSVDREIDDLEVLWNVVPDCATLTMEETLKYLNSIR